MTAQAQSSELTAAERKLFADAVRFNLAVVSLVSGAVSGACVWLATAVLLMKGGAQVGAHLGLLAAFFPGYSVTWSGSWIGFAWGFVAGALSGAAIYSTYARRLRPNSIADLLDTGTAEPYRIPVLTISGHACGLALGSLAALQLVLMTNWLAVRGPAAAIESAALLTHFFKGYSVTLTGSLIGAVQAFVLAYLVALLGATVYNGIATRRAPPPPAPRRKAPETVPPTHVVVLGAGPAGLAAGHELTKLGVRVTLLEQNDYVGGLCRTVEDAGYRFDLGGHRWFTKNEDLNIWFRRLMGDEIVMVNRISRIYYDRKFYRYPVSVGDVLRNAGVLTLVRAALSYAASAVRYGALNRPVRNMKDGYVAQFGNTLYEMFFRRYSEKVWGSPCEKLSADWVGQRSKGLSVWTVAREALAARKSGVRSLIEEFMYPRDGYMRIPERMAEDIRAAKGDVILQATAARIECHGPHDFTVVYRTQSGRERVSASHVVSTIPLGALARMTLPAADPVVIHAAGSLRFRDLVTVNVKLARERVSSDTWLYVQDENVLFGRLHEPKNWSRAMVPDATHTSLVLECFCSAGDSTWSRSDDEIAAQCIADLEQKLGFIAKAEVIGWNVVRSRYAYPIYDLDYAKHVAVIMSHLARMPGLSIVGRGGSFRYNNADHSIEMGLLLARRILGYDVDPLDVNTEQEYHEEIGEHPMARGRFRVEGEADARIGA